MLLLLLSFFFFAAEPRDVRQNSSQLRRQDLTTRTTIPPATQGIAYRANKTKKTVSPHLQAFPVVNLRLFFNNNPWP